MASRATIPTKPSRPRAKARGVAAVGSDENAQTNATRADILTAAAKLIVDEGFSACTMRAVADRIEIKAGSLYYHFASKDEIIEEILNTGIAALLEHVKAALAAVPADAPFAQRLAVAVEAHLACLVGGEAGYVHVYEHLPPIFKRRSRTMRNTYAKVWFELFAQGSQQNEVDGSIDLAVFVPYFLGGLNRVPEWLGRQKGKRRAVAAVATSTLLQGILSEPGRRAANRTRAAA